MSEKKQIVRVWINDTGADVEFPGSSFEIRPDGVLIVFHKDAEPTFFSPHGWRCVQKEQPGETSGE